MASSGTLAPGLARKVKKILELRTESPELLGALATLSAFYSDNSADERRRLRSSIEQRALSVNEHFLSAAEAIIKALDQVQKEVDGVAGACRRINTALQTSKAASAEMVAETERIARDLAMSRSRAQLVSHFLEQYQLTGEEVAALQGEEIGDAFFAALERVRSIHANCRSLLRTHHQRAGLELMDAMANYQEAAYERLCRWLQAECRHLGDADAPEVDPRLQRAAEALRGAPRPLPLLRRGSRLRAPQRPLPAADSGAHQGEARGDAAPDRDACARPQGGTLGHAGLDPSGSGGRAGTLHQPVWRGRPPACPPPSLPRKWESANYALTLQRNKRGHAQYGGPSGSCF
eukprot:jgi/Botrbrau1/15442/Bobra.43_2s0067.1